MHSLDGRILNIKRTAFLLLGGCLVASAPPTHAQGVFDMGMLTSSLSIDHVTQSERARAANISGPNLSLRTLQQISRPTLTSHTPQETRFKTSKTVRQANLARMVERTAATDPQGAKEMAKLFANVDVIGQINQAISSYGLRADNVSDAYTVYWMTAWQAAHQQSGDFDANTVAAVQRQSANILMSTPEFVNADNNVKQEMAEIYLVQAAIIEAIAEEAKSDQAMRSNLANAVRQGARASGIDLTKMTLTPNGFVPRNGGRSDASDPAADNTQLAANDDGGSNLALYAVAGTGLLAGVFALGKGLSKKG